MDSDLIKLVNRLQDTFSNLGESYKDYGTRVCIDLGVEQVVSSICHS